jgi:hypothetical protein
MRLAVNIVRKDWQEYKKPLLGLTASLCATIIFTKFVPLRSESFTRGLIMGAVMGGCYGFAQTCFYNERQRGTLGFLLSLPVTPVRLVLAKYASVFSMVIFCVNVPGVLLQDFQFLAFANVAALFLSTLCTAATVISGKPWAPQLPLWIIVVVAIPAPRIPGFLAAARSLASHSTWLAVVALSLIPIIALASALIFSRHSLKSV